jgi:hypothetical protein
MKKNTAKDLRIDLFRVIVYNRAMENAIVDEFTALINKCQGKVFFLTSEGDRLVADSMLSALVGISTVLSLDDGVPLPIECEAVADCDRIVGFIRKYHLGRCWST